MKNFEGLPPSAKPTQTPERAPEMENRFRVGEMESILKRVEPIEGVFNPDEEVKNLWSVPKEQRREAVSTFKDKLARQREAWALCRTSIEERIESNPGLPREEMVEIVREFASHYGFAESYIKVADSLLDDYLEMHRRMNEAREKYPDNIALIKRLTGIKFTKSDAEDFTVLAGPMSIEISCSGFNAGRVYEKSKNPVVGFKFGGFASTSRDSKPVYYLVVNEDYSSNNPDYYTTIVPHEREHQKNRILKPKLYSKGKVRTDVKEGLNRGVLGFLRRRVGEKLLGFERKFEDEVFVRYTSARDPEEKSFLLGEYMRLEREGALNRAKDEIIARKTEPDYVSWSNDSSLFDVGGSYDFFADLRDFDKKKKDPLWQETAKRVLVDEYRDIIDNAIVAFDQLKESGYSQAETIAMLSDKRLADWPKTVRRLLEQKE